MGSNKTTALRKAQDEKRGTLRPKSFLKTLNDSPPTFHWSTILCQRLVLNTKTWLLQHSTATVEAYKTNESNLDVKTTETNWFTLLVPNFETTSFFLATNVPRLKTRQALATWNAWIVKIKCWTVERTVFAKKRELNNKSWNSAVIFIAIILTVVNKSESQALSSQQHMDHMLTLSASWAWIWKLYTLFRSYVDSTLLFKIYRSWILNQIYATAAEEGNQTKTHITTGRPESLALIVMKLLFSSTKQMYLVACSLNVNNTW